MEPSSTALGKTKGNAPGWYGVTNPLGMMRAWRRHPHGGLPPTLGCGAAGRGQSPTACLPAWLQPGSGYSPASQARTDGANPSQQGLQESQLLWDPWGPRRWFCARGAAASHRTPDPELHPVCAQPLSVSNPYKWRGHDGQNQPNRCFVHQCLLSLLASLQIRYFMHSSW